MVQLWPEVLAEVARVLRPGGVLAAIAPALRPLGPADVRTLTNINTRLRTKPQFPGPVELTGFAKALTAQGMRAVEDTRERYRFGVRTRADAELMMSALYLPNTGRYGSTGLWTTSPTGWRNRRWSRWPSRCGRLVAIK